MYLVDTNVVSELRKTTRAEPAVLAWAAAQSPGMTHLSVMSLMELEIGVLRIERRDKPQGERLRQWLEQAVVSRFEDRILGVDATVARVCARLHVPDPRPERDALIAATALVHGLTLVTRNTADFEPMGVALFNPWLASSA
ncbi:MAG: type II toxin-antitoxin system VapC family toxin [Proteobacteria bacterium]|nr:type II toxin-antitoxin system VapC family toxin [Pseudomonadota bacterium]